MQRNSLSPLTHKLKLKLKPKLTMSSTVPATVQASASKDEFKDDASRVESNEFDWKFAGIALVATAVIFGTIIGVLVNQNNSLDTSPDPAPAPVTDGNSTDTVTVQSSGSATTVDLDCDVMMKDFSTKAIVMTMAVSSSISAVEINYAANTLEKTYSSMLSNQLEQARADYCDPYCRMISAVTVDSNSLMTSEATAEARQAGTDDCDAMLELTFNVEGSYYGCEDTVFPGLFASPEARRMLRASVVGSSSSNVRFLQDAEEDMMEEEAMMEDGEMEDTTEDDMDASCPVCPDDVQSLGLVSPTSAQLKNVIKPFVTVLPAICGLNKVEVIPSNDE